MPALKNVRQEKFARLVVSGVPPFRAYPEAGYSAHPGEPYRLRENPRVKKRMEELTKNVLKAADLTEDKIAQMLIEEATPGVRDDATSSSRTSALKILAQYKSMLTMNTADKTPGKDLEALVSKLGEILPAEHKEFVVSDLRRKLGLDASNQEAHNAEHGKQ